MVLSVRHCDKKHILFYFIYLSRPAKLRDSTRESPARLPLDGLAHTIHDFRISGGLRGQCVYRHCKNARRGSKRPHPHHPPPHHHHHPSLPPSRSLNLGKMLVVLRDGRKLHGVLRSYDQFGASRGSLRLTDPPFIIISFYPSKSSPGGHLRANISRQRVRGELARHLSDPRRERRAPGGNCQFTTTGSGQIYILTLLWIFIMKGPRPRR